MPYVEPIRSVLLLQSGALGDTVLQLRIAEALRYACPGVHITWLGRDRWLPVARYCPFVDEALGLDAMRSHRLFQEGLETDPDLAALLGRSDLIINGLSAADSPMMARVARMARQMAVCYEPKPQVGSREHVCRQWLGQIAGQLARRFPAVSAVLDAYAASVGKEGTALLLADRNDLAPTQDRLKAAGVDPASVSGRLVLLHPGSGGTHKCYGLDRYLDLYRLLLLRQMQAVFLVGPAEVERWEEQVDGLARQCAVIRDPSLAMLIRLGEARNCVCGQRCGSDACGCGCGGGDGGGVRADGYAGMATAGAAGDGAGVAGA